MSVDARLLRKRTGFTLIELMIAMVILSIGLFAIVQMEVVSVRGNGYARERMEALQIARGVVEELRTKALEWTMFSGGTGQDLNATLGTIEPNVVDQPEGAELAMSDMHSQVSYGGATIASGSDFNNSRLINLDGLGPNVPEVTDPTSLETARAVYRVHYVASRVRLQGATGGGSNDIIRLTVFVSWDNKDLGRQDYTWQSAAAGDFWKRHVVAVTAYMSRDYHWS